MQPITYCRSDYNLLRCGKAEGMYALHGELYAVKGAARGFYCSAVYDSGTGGMEWNRLCLNHSGEGRFALSVWIGDVMPPNTVSCAEARVWFAGNAVLTANGADILLYGCHGRYFQFCAEVFFGEEEFCLRGFEASFPKQVFTEYLPQIYQGNPTLERFFSIVQAVYLDTAARIEGFPRQLDPVLAEDDALRELARWVGAEEWIAGVSRDVAERLVREAVWLHRRRGTRVALSRFIELLTGSEPVLVEPFEWARLSKNIGERRIYAELYGDSGGLACILPEEPPMGRERLRKLLEDFLPAGVECHLVFLREQTTMGGHGYLGVNTRLADREEPVLGSGLLRLGMARLTGKPPKEK